LRSEPPGLRLCASLGRALNKSETTRYEAAAPSLMHRQSLLSY